MKIRLLTLVLLTLSLIWLTSEFTRHPEMVAAQSSPAQVNSLDFTTVVAGEKHTCALTVDGGVRCWGSNRFGQLGDGTNIHRSIPVVVTGLESGVSSIAANGDHTCALIADGGIKCWGRNRSGQLGDGTTTDHSVPVDVIGLTSDINAVTVGKDYTCALTVDGGVKCWGYNGYGQLGDGTQITRQQPVDVIGLTSGVDTIATGGDHTCAVTDSGGAKCWGFNTYGQLGDNTTTNRNEPVDVTWLTSGVSDITVGWDHTCALTIDGGIKCWGNNRDGQLGDGTSFNNRITPVNVVGLVSGVSHVTAGFSHTCALTAGGGVKCWGWNFAGQLGNGTNYPHNMPVDVTGLTSGVKTVAAGGLHTCVVIDSDGVKCWGDNTSGQIGDGVTIRRSIPMDVLDLGSDVNTADTGRHFTCVLKASDGVKCWGMNWYGQLGDGTTNDRNTPVNVIGLSPDVVSTAAGFGHTCALISNGGVKCWGNNRDGQLGDGTNILSFMPTDVIGLTSGVDAITAENDHTCALTVSGGVKCWGANWYGPLGDGTSSNRNTPVDVIGLTSGVNAITAGTNHTCALTGSGGVKCWGSNSSGQLGNGTNYNHYTPEDVTGLSSGVVAIAAGEEHTCAVTGSGGVKCWGANLSGQLGDGTTSDSNIPVDVIGLSNGISGIFTGGNYTCALTIEDGVKCWGANAAGQLGDGTITNRSAPVNVTGLSSGVSTLTVGSAHACALLNDGRLKCWGSDSYGQLGIGTMAQHLTPADVMENLSAALSINYTTGQTGSYFTLTGENFSPSSPLTITVNEITLTSALQTNETGGFILFLNTSEADLGVYQVSASVNSSASAWFTLDATAPLRPQEGGGETLMVPGGITAPTQHVYLPVIIQ